MNNKKHDSEEGRKQKSRLKEITEVLHRNKITRGVSPEKLRVIIEELGATYIKLGQIMSLHSDILPKRYCDELMRLHSEVPAMPFEQVEEVILESYGFPWTEVFSAIEPIPLGSASIAQVHKAVLKSGEEVVIKVQRRGIAETMAKDIRLLHKAVRLLPGDAIKGMVDLDLVLDELWRVTQEEMNFLIEAANIEEFTRNNREVVFVQIPKLYKEYTTSHVLVMEYIDGYAINDKEHLLEDGYDLEEIGSKLVDNFIRQIIEDGFFHADPHPGNVRIRDGKIVWIDMGMMGRLTQRDKELIGNAVRGVALRDTGMISDAVLSLGEFNGKPDQSCLYEDIDILMTRYGSKNMGEVDIAETIQDLMEVMKENRIAMPHGLTMLARGLTHMEGVLAEISPNINMVEIAASRMKESFYTHFDWQKELKKGGRHLYRSLYKAIDIPALISDVIQGHLKGQMKINLDLHVADDMERLLRRVARNVVMGLWVMALLISSSIICTTDMTPKIAGIPAIGAFGYLLAFAIVLYVFIKHILSKH